MAESGVAVAGPKVRFRFFRKLCFEGVSFDVPAGLEEVRVVEDRETFVTALPEVTRNSVDPAVVPGVRELKALKGGYHRLSLLGVE